MLVFGRAVDHGDDAVGRLNLFISATPLGNERRQIVARPMLNGLNSMMAEPIENGRAVGGIMTARQKSFAQRFTVSANNRW